MSDPLRNFQPTYRDGEHAFITMRAGPANLVTVLEYAGENKCGVCTPHYHVRLSSDPAILCVTSAFLVPCACALHKRRPPEPVYEPSPYRHARHEVA